MNPVKDAVFFFRHFLRHPLQVSSIIPTRKAVAARITEHIPERGPWTIVEYGPGTGVLARAFLKSGKLSEDASIILIEKTKEFADELRRTIRDPRVHVFHDSVENVRGVLASCGRESADYVFCSIPLSVMPTSALTRILTETNAVLTERGEFIAFIARPGIKSTLLKHFSDIRMRVEPFNVPPLFIFRSKKRPPVRATVS